MDAVVLTDLVLGYAGRPVVSGVSGAFAAGQTTVIVGPNGSGKSTLLKAVAGDRRPLSGRIARAGLRRRNIAYLPQDIAVDRNFPITVADLVALGFERRLGLFRGLGPAERAELSAAMEAVGLSGLDHRSIDALSGGQFQRALFARVMVEDAPLILLDEPFAAQDARTTGDLLQIIRRWQDDGRTLIIVLHDLEMARALGAEALIMARCCIAWGPAASVLTAEHLERAHDVSAHWPPDAAT